MTQWPPSGSPAPPPNVPHAWPGAPDNRAAQVPLPPVTVWGASAAALIALVLVVVLGATGALADLIAEPGVRSEDSTVLAALACTSVLAGLAVGVGALVSGQGRRLLTASGVATVLLGAAALLGALLVGDDGLVLPVTGTLLLATGSVVAVLASTRSASWWVTASERRSAERVIAGLAGSPAQHGQVPGRGPGSLAGAIGAIVAVLFVGALVVASVMPETTSGSEPDFLAELDSLAEPGLVPVDAGDYEWEPYLDGLAEDCADGDLASCDDLYYEADAFSEYEEYGSTCGARSEREYMGECSAHFD